jgi:hypothetical protein
MDDSEGQAPQMPFMQGGKEGEGDGQPQVPMMGAFEAEEPQAPSFFQHESDGEGGENEQPWMF